jgi:hypothetical protein
MRETETTMSNKPDQRIEWPPPREDPDREPSHPGARLDELEERLASEEDRRGTEP